MLPETLTDPEETGLDMNHIRTKVLITDGR